MNARDSTVNLLEHITEQEQRQQQPNDWCEKIKSQEYGVYAFLMDDD